MLEIAITIFIFGAFAAFMAIEDSGFKGFLIVAVVAVLFQAPFWVIGFTGIAVETSQGEHTGFVTAAQKNGLLFKTGRAYVKTDLSSSQEDLYCVKDDVVLNQLQEAAKSRERVTIKYSGNFVNGLVNCNGENEFIYQVAR